MKPKRVDADGIHRLHADGLTDEQIVEQTGASLRSVERARRRMSLSPNRTDRTKRRSGPLNDRMRAAVLEVWGEYGGAVRKCIGKAFPSLAKSATAILGNDGFEAACLRGLCLAASRFDASRGTKLISYAIPYMRNETQRDIRSATGRNSRGEEVRLLQAAVEWEDGGEARAVELLAVDRDGDTRAERDDTRAVVRGQIGRLSPRLRQVVMGRFFFGLSSVELAKVLRVAPQRVRQLQSVALHHLKQRLAEDQA